MSRSALSLTSLFWLTLVGIAAAQPTPEPGDPGVASLQDFSGAVSYGGMYFNLYNMAGDGVGYKHGYTQFGIVAPYWINENVVVAGNGRMTITDAHDVGGNLGGFVRYLNPNTDRILGFNGFFDIDRSVYNNDFRQFGFGVESLGQFLDFRANAYIPTTTSDNFIQPLGFINATDPIYFQNRIGFLGVAQYEESLSGGDFEFGVPVSPQATWLRAYAGMYAYQAKVNDPVGFRGRLEGWVSDDLSLGVQVTDDKQFGTNVNANVNFLFSGWKPTRWFPNFETRERMLTPIQRNWRVATGAYNQNVNVPGYNPRTNQPYFITWVDNSATAPGDGTFENPFTSMPGSAPGDLILVRNGISTPITPVLGSIVLSDYQRLLGQGREHTIQMYANYGPVHIPTQTYNLPEFTNTGNYPYLFSPNNIVTLANNNEVSAFNMLNSNGAAITNTGAGSRNFDLNYLNLTNNAGGGIRLTQASGTGLINNVNALNNAAGGIFLDSGATPLALTMRDVTSDSNPAGTQAFGVSINADNAAITALLENIRTNRNDAGIILTETNSRITATLDNITSINNVNGPGDGIRATGVGGVIDLDLNNVTTTGNFGRGVYVTGNNTDILFEQTNLTANGNNNNNVEFALTNGSTLFGGLQNINVSNSGIGSGLVLSAAGNSVIGSLVNPFILSNVTSDGNALHGLDVQGLTSGDQVIAVLNSRFRNNTLDGFHFDLASGATLAAGFNTVNLDDNNRSAVLGTVVGASALDLEMANILARRSQDDGMFITSSGGSDVFVDLTDAQFSNSGQSGAGGHSAIRIDAASSNVDLNLLRTLANNTVAFPAGTQDFGMQLNLTGATQFAGSAINSNFSNNGVDGIALAASNTSFGTLGFTGSTANGNGVDGLDALTQSGTQFTINATDSFFNNNGLSGTGNGMSLVTSGTLIANLDNTQVNNNNNYGIFGQANTATGALRVSTTNNTAINSNDTNDGVFLDNVGGTVQGSFVDTSIANNFLGGVRYNAVGGLASSLSFENSTVNGNLGGAGLLMNLNNGLLQVDALDTSFSNNDDEGVAGVFDNNSVVLINTFENVTADNNDLEGLRLVASNNSELNGNINGGSFSNNGTAATTIDGVNAQSLTGSLVQLCFDGTLANNNEGDGFDFEATGAGSEIYVALQSSVTYGQLQATGNDEQAVEFDVGPGATGFLFMEGNNDFSGNGAATPITYTANGAANAAFTFSGTSSNNTGDGLTVNMTNVAQAWIDIHDATLTNNGGNGVALNLTNVTFANAALNVNFLQGPFTAQPFQIVDSDISGNTGGNGIFLDATNVTMPAQGNIARNTIDGNDQSNVDITFDGTSLIENLSISDNTSISDSVTGDGVRVLVSGTADVGLAINNNVLNTNRNGSAIDVEYRAGTTSNGNPVDISGNTVFQNGTGSNDDGIAVLLTNATITTLNLDENVIDESGDDGISITSTGSTITTLNITDSGIRANVGHGINLDLDSTLITDLNITGNRQGTSNLIGLGFQIIGNTFGQPFSITNTAGPGNNITDFQLDITPSGNEWDTEEPGLSIAFAPVGTSAIDTGLTTINGNPFPNLLPSGGLPDAQGILDLAFADFNPGETFTWDADVDQIGVGASTVLGSDLVGSDITVNFTGGLFITGTLQPLGVDGAQFVQAGGNLVSPGIDGNGGDGVHVELTNGTNITNLNILDNEINNNQSTTGGGVNFAVVDNSTIGDLEIADNNVLSNAGDGIRFGTVTNGSAIGPITVDTNIINSNGVGNNGDGFDFGTITNSTIGAVVFNANTITENGRDGVRLVTPDTSNNTLNLAFTDNTISQNVANGVNIELNGLERLENLTMTGNTIGSIGAGNGGMGVRLDLSNTASFNAIIGDSTLGVAGANSFTANQDAGFGITMRNGTSGELLVENSSFNNNVDGADINFAGVGLGIVLIDQATLDQAGPAITLGNAAADDTFFNNNASHGFSVLTDSTAVVENVLIQRITASGNGTGADGGDGLNFVRQGNSQITNVLIDRSTITDNVDDGVDITAAARNITDVYTLTTNTITGNGESGVALTLIADADLDVTINNGNIISENGQNGIQATTIADVTDTPTLLLEVDGNTINTNTGSGIAIAAIHELLINDNDIGGNTVDGMTIAVAVTNLGLNGGIDVISNNRITGNGRDGINYSATSSSFPALLNQITGNTITSNGDDGIDLNSAYLATNIQGNTIGGVNAADGNGDDGIAITSSGTFQRTVINNNTIQNNDGDGIQIAATNGSGTNFFVGRNNFTITNNRIFDSGRRGINVVNAGDADTRLQIGSFANPALGNLISRSGLEGIYIVNTASNTQANDTNINNLASTTLIADGSLFATPDLDLFVDNNDLDSNGNTNTVSNFIGASGLVLRVGTSDASTSFADPGGTAATRAGVVANIRNNSFGGQFGADVTFAPFISTVVPPTTGGEWTDQNTNPRVPADDVFNPVGYVSDPLARLDLTFTGNFGQGVITNNAASATAFYDNNEPVFKSRTTTQDNATDAPDAPGDDDGPFLAGTRRRNATRQAARNGLPPSSVIGASNSFLYPGISGNSTFRTSAASNTNGFDSGDDDFTTTVPIGGAFGELDFIWGSF